MLSKYIKFVLILILTLFLNPGICSNNICAEAAVSGQPQIYADALTIKAGDSASLPVLVKNNPGMMGYLITVEYDSEKIEIESVRAGNLSANGVFDYNISPENADSALILWSYTKEVAGDGTLFYLNIRAKENIGRDKTLIRLKYSDEDTFNEKYETVHLECIPIEVKGGKKTVVKLPEESAGVRTESPEAGYQVDSDNSKTVQSGKNEQTEASASAENKNSKTTQNESSTAAQSETAEAAQNKTSTAAQTETPKAMQKDTADMAQPEQSKQPKQPGEADKVTDNNQNEETGAAGEYYADESMNGGDDADGDEVETTDGKTIVIDDVVKSREDNEKENWLMTIGIAAAGVVLVGVLGVMWRKMRNIKGEKDK